MSKKPVETPIDLSVTWDNGVGEVSPDSFKNNLPEDLKEEHFEAVDSYREQFAATVGEHMMQQAQEHFKTETGDLSIMDVGIGGRTTLAMVMSNDYHMVTTITTATGTALQAVQDKAKEMYKQHMDA